MNFFSSDSIKKQILSICKERGLLQSLNEYCSLHSNGRTQKLNELTELERRKFFNALIELNDNAVLEGIYTIANDLSILNGSIIDRDNLIIDFLKAELIIDFISNEIKIPGNKPERIKITSPLSKVCYTGKLMIAQLLGNILLRKMETYN